MAVVLAMKMPMREIQEQPLVEVEPGTYHITIAPKLDKELLVLKYLVPLIIDAELHVANWSAQLFKLTKNKDKLSFLLAVSMREQTLFIQAIQGKNTATSEMHISEYLQEFVNGVMVNLPINEQLSEQNQQVLLIVIQQWSALNGLEAQRLNGTK